MDEIKAKIFVYLRVSTELQDEGSQISAIDDFLKTQKVEIIKTFQDHALSGKKNVKRPEFEEMLRRLDEVDGICVFDWDRLTRDEETGVLLMYRVKNAQKKVFEARTRSILTFERMDQRVLTVLKSMMAEEERKKIHERQKAGIENYKKKNKRWGRKATKINWKQYSEYLDMGLPKTQIAKLFGICTKTLYKLLKAEGMKE